MPFPTCLKAVLCSWFAKVGGEFPVFLSQHHFICVNVKTKGKSGKVSDLKTCKTQMYVTTTLKLLTETFCSCVFTTPDKESTSNPVQSVLMPATNLIANIKAKSE